MIVSLIRRSRRLVLSAHVLHGADDEFFQHLFVDIRQAFYVEARLTRTVLAQLCHQCVESLEPGHDVKGQVLFTRRKANQHPITLTTARVFVMIAAKADDSRTPHLCARTRRHPHHRRHFLCVSTFLLVFDAVEYFSETIVDGVKEASKNGKITKEELQNLEKDSIKYVIDMLDDEAVQLLKDSKVDISKLILTKIKSRVRLNKYGGNLPKNGSKPGAA